MKTLFPNAPIAEVLGTNKGKVLVFTPMSEQECIEFKSTLNRYLLFPKLSPKREELNDELYRHHKIRFDDVVAIGDTHMDTRLANSYIEMVTTKLNDAPRRMFKCFVNKDWKNPQNKINLPYHDDGGCSWNCLMQKLKMPKYGILYTINVLDVMILNHFKILKEVKHD